MSRKRRQDYPLRIDGASIDLSREEADVPAVESPGDVIQGQEMNNSQEHLQKHDAMLKRLARVEGQIRGIQAMIRRGVECDAVAVQFRAARKALDKAYQELLMCLVEDSMIDDGQSTEEKLAQVRAIFTKYT